MYYAIELFNNHDITVRDVSDSYVDEMIEELPFYKDKTMFSTPDGIVVTNYKVSSFYLKDKNKRRKLLNNLLESEDCYTNTNFFLNAVSANENVENV